MNPLIGTTPDETIESVKNVLEFLTWHSLEGEHTEDIEDGRKLILQACTQALESVNQE